MNTTLVLLLAYSAALIALGLWLGRRVSSVGGFFVAGRSLGPGLLFATILAANIGAGTTIGAAGLGYRDGLAGWWWVGSAGVGSLVLALWVGPRIWAIARARGHLTLGDYLDDRYGPSVRAIIAVLLWLGTLALLAGQLIAMADIFTGVAGWPRGWGVVVGGVVATAYFAAGGLMVAAWVNLVQLVVMVIGFGIALPWAMAAAGGWEAVARRRSARRPELLAARRIRLALSGPAGSRLRDLPGSHPEGLRRGRRPGHPHRPLRHRRRPLCSSPPSPRCWAWWLACTTRPSPTTNSPFRSCSLWASPSGSAPSAWRRSSRRS